MAGEARIMEVDPSTDTKHLVQGPTPLNDSLLWVLSANYYKRMAVEAWSENYVPMFITSNSRFAKLYAKIALSILQDWNRQKKERPFCFLEVGAGHGRFSFLFLTHILRTQPLWQRLGLPERPFVYVISDVAEKNIAFCMKHPAMQQFIKGGWLKSCIFDANIENEASDLMLSSGPVDLSPTEPLERGTPMMLISNYVLDSLYTESLQLRLRKKGNSHERQISRSLLSIFSDQDELDPTNPDIISRMTLKWEWQDFGYSTTDITDEEQYTAKSGDSTPLDYLEPVLSRSQFIRESVIKAAGVRTTEIRDDTKPAVSLPENIQSPEGKDAGDSPQFLTKEVKYILDQYWVKLLHNIPGYDVLSVVLPCGAFRLFDYLYKYSECKLISIIGDKGYADPDEFRGDKTPHIAIHGSVSFMVNMHAIGSYFSSKRNGFHCSTPYRDTFQVLVGCAFDLPSQHPGFGSLLKTLAEEVDDMPPDSLIALQKQLLQEGGDTSTVSSGRAGPAASPPLRALLSILRYSAHDPDVFLNLRKDFIAQAVPPLLGARTESDLQRDLELVYNHWYRVRDVTSESNDLCEVIAQLSMKIGRLDRALFFFEKSNEAPALARHPATYVNMAACAKAMGDIARARSCLQEAFSLQADFKPALDLHTNLEMSARPLNVVLVGLGEWLQSCLVPLLARDRRVRVRGVYAFSAQDASSMKEYFLKCRGARVLDEDTNDSLSRDSERRIRVKVYSGSEGLNDILRDPEIEACFIDVHSSLMVSMVRRILKARKHCFCNTPIDLTAKGAVGGLCEYLEIKKKAAVIWNARNSVRSEDGLLAACKILKKEAAGLGLPSAVHCTSGAFVASTFRSSTLRDSALDDLIRLLTSVSVVLGAEDTSIFRVAVKTTRFGSASITTSGWFDFMREGANDQSDRVGTCEVIRGSLLCHRAAHTHQSSASGAPVTRITVVCTKESSITIELEGSAWVLAVKKGNTIIRKEAASVSGDATSVDSFLHQTHAKIDHSTVSTRASSQEAIERQPRDGTTGGTVHTSLLSAAADASLAEALIASMEHDGCPVTVPSLDLTSH